jgi:hypothetical protein
MALYATDVDRMKCRVKGCGCDQRTLYFRSRCHPKAPTWARYDVGSAVLVVECATCTRMVAEFALSVGERWRSVSTGSARS